MVQYQYARDEGGEVQSADSLRGTTTTGSHFQCISCKNSMIAKVNGEKHRPHFAHRESIECNGETYLHILGKELFASKYRQCISSGDPFWIELHVPRWCRKYSKYGVGPCHKGDIGVKHDLTQYYREIRVETRDGNFIPDLSLHSKDRPDDAVYIEIAVTHFLSEEKESSGKRIIQIPLQCEGDLSPILSGIITDKVASFVGFDIRGEVIPDAECECRSIPVHVFSVYTNGKCHGRAALLSEVPGLIKRRPSLEYCNVTKIRNASFPLSGDGDLSRAFQDGLLLARQSSAPVKNCFACKYHKTAYIPGTGEPIYCPLLKRTVPSNHAAECGKFHATPI